MKMDIKQNKARLKLEKNKFCKKNRGTQDIENEIDRGNNYVDSTHEACQT